MLKKPLFLELIILSLVVLALHIIATVYHLYWSIYEFDSLLHFLGGVVLTFFFLWLYFFSGYFDPQKRSLIKFLFIAFLGTIFASVLWETYELIFKQTLVEKADYPYDTTMDLLMDTLGAVAGSFYAYIREFNGQMIVKNINESNEQQS